MTFAAALRRAASSAAPLAAAALCRGAIHRSTAFRRIPVPLHQRFSRGFSSSSTADAKLLKVIEDEIRSSVESADRDKDLVPSGFLFEIIDNPGDETIILKRELAGENISVVVLNPEADVDMEEDEVEDHSGDEEGSVKLSINLMVTIDKGDASSLEFSCSVGPEELQIHYMTIKNKTVSDDQKPYEGPPFSDLDEDLQKELYKYLESRGIASSLFEFLHEYMIKKDDREYLTWLNNMKEFIQA